MNALTSFGIVTRLTAPFRKLHFLRGSSRLLFAWPLGALLVGLIGWQLLLSSLDEQRIERETVVLHEAEILSRTYADQLVRTLEAVDQILLHVKYEWELSGGKLRLEDISKRGLFPPSYLFNVYILDRNGKVLTTTIPDALDVDATDRPYFALQKSALSDSFYIGQALYSESERKNVIHFSRQLRDKNNAFDGVVMVSVIPAYLTAGYDTATLGDSGLLALVGFDKLIRATRIGSSPYPVQTPALLRMPRFLSESGSALFNGRDWFRDERNRYIGWHPVDGYPLIAIAGIDEKTAFASYWNHHASSIRDALWATAGLLAFMLTGLVLSMRLAWRKHQLVLTQATYRMATEGGNEGFYIARPIRSGGAEVSDFEIIDCNQRGAEFLRHRREELIGKRISAIYQNAGPPRLLIGMRQALETGAFENDIKVSAGSPVVLRWIHLKIVRSGGDLAMTLRDISDAREHVEELERRGNEDALTGLPNRHWAQSYLPAMIERSAPDGDMHALLFIDLDGFKAVNDTMGHAAGDELLKIAARRLKVAVRPHDKVVRIGGDEFVVIIEDIAQRSDAAHVARRVLHAFQEGFRLTQGVRSVGTSIGISIFPSDGSDADTLLKNADIAMYSVKTGGKSNYRFYDQKYYEKLRARHDKEDDLRRAIENDEFLMYYQPRVDISTGTTSSMEALVRWQHPSKGLLEPLDFIPLAEETGLIAGLGALAIEKVCAQLARWAKTGQELVPVSINVSPRQFDKTDVPKLLAESLAHHGVAARLVEIEVTESSMMSHGGEVSEVLAAIQGMGIKLLVDDFGTGYSSLSQLQSLDFDVLKVDRAFTAGLEKSEQGNVLFAAIITMAHALGMRVVAEGVENERQIRILKSLRCDEIQGFYISKPLPPSETQPILPKWFFPSTA
ncbi:EAL domain-containing protein [Noviherbaspirillum cavernae]|uniref:EAL domain-containing protein n=1 Tax=Noviherbaspirillum cavernae TaxID=2320862 RepID=A0A418X0V8_9BURK|nr:EAL domain-containing protein [Noviherbaspirillum cavernae]RJG06062.1 EAL domain-containing protein [Noviherbaspirillum cavernae]